MDVVLFPSLLHLQLASQLLPSGAGSPFALGAQNAWEGAVTEGVAGGVGGAMLREMGVEWTMLGHSDRRNKLGESAQLVGDKAAAALQAHPRPPPQPPPPHSAILTSPAEACVLPFPLLRRRACSST